jgi:hypothetical protein
VGCVIGWGPIAKFTTAKVVSSHRPSCFPCQNPCVPATGVRHGEAEEVCEAAQEVLMRWKLKPMPNGPQLDDRRVRYVFAWRPTVVGEQVVWLEWFRVYEVYGKLLSGPESAVRLWLPGWCEQFRRIGRMT